MDLNLAIKICENNNEKLIKLREETIKLIAKQDKILNNTNKEIIKNFNDIDDMKKTMVICNATINKEKEKEESEEESEEEESEEEESGEEESGEEESGEDKFTTPTNPRKMLKFSSGPGAGHKFCKFCEKRIASRTRYCTFCSLDNY